MFNPSSPMNTNKNSSADITSTTTVVTAKVDLLSELQNLLILLGEKDPLDLKIAAAYKCNLTKTSQRGVDCSKKDQSVSNVLTVDEEHQHEPKRMKLTKSTKATLSTTTATKVSSPPLHSNTTQNSSLDVQAALNIADAALMSLFEKHVGPFEHVLNGMMRLHGVEVDDVMQEYPPEERYRCPFFRMIQTPKPDLMQYTELLFGMTARDVAMAEKDIADRLNLVNENLMPFKRDCVTFQYKANILANALLCLREQAKNFVSEEENNSVWKLLRFAVTYGLSGAMRDILGGKYCDVGDDFTIDTAMPIVDEPEVKETLFMDPILYAPAYFIGSILEHPHVVKCALSDLGGSLHAKYCIKGSEAKQQSLYNANTAGQALLWAIHANSPDMVRCLTKDCGVQFRWMSKNEFDQIWDLLLDYDPYENGPFRGNFDSEELVFLSSRERAWARSHASWKNKEAMIKVLIECGLPRELFLPQIDFSLEKEVLNNCGGKDPSNEDQEKIEEYNRGLSKAERKSLRRIYNACSEFNSVQETEEIGDEDDSCSDCDEIGNVPHKLTKDTTLHLPYFYDRMVDKWKDQTDVQESKLSDFEELDPRWAEERKNESRAIMGGTEEEVSDFESDDGSDY
mmetsp:Transcript_3685/g.5711  ORF Transcript_3685/g.5711 Transcript_3685/m.5711 type:complete len:625 (-) Transcript_3685:105-1979(-)